MKTALTTLAALLSATTLLADDAYHVRDIDPDSPKFEKILKAVERTRYSIDTGYRMELRIINHIDGQLYLVRPVEWVSGNPTGKEKPSSRKIYAINVPGDKRLADDDKIFLNVLVSEKVFEYTNVTGSKSSVSYLFVAEEIAPLTKEEFLEKLKSGSTFVATTEKKVKCSTCAGYGHNRSLTPARCKACRGRGQWTTEQRLHIKW